VNRRKQRGRLKKYNVGSLTTGRPVGDVYKRTDSETWAFYLDARVELGLFSVRGASTGGMGFNSVLILLLLTRSSEEIKNFSTFQLQAPL